MRFIEFLKNKCIEETHCIKDNFEENWEYFINLEEEERLSDYAEEWKKQELINVFEAIKKVEISAGIKELNKIN